LLFEVRMGANTSCSHIPATTCRTTQFRKYSNALLAAIPKILQFKIIFSITFTRLFDKFLQKNGRNNAKCILEMFFHYFANKTSGELFAFFVSKLRFLCHSAKLTSTFECFKLSPLFATFEYNA